LASYSKVDKYGFILTPFRKVKHTVKNDGKDGINKIALADILSDKGEIIVQDKAYITKELAEKLQKELSAKEIEVRGYLTSEFDYFDAHQERALVIAEANSEIDAF
jgi:DNA-directed RNA polymerase subunit beta